MNKYVSALLLAFAMAVPSLSFAGLDSATMTDIQTGITSAETDYFVIGGTILVVLAGIWGFKMVKRLF